MARCGACRGEFEGARQPNCPLCGAPRPRPKIPPPRPTPDLAAAVEELGANRTPPRRARRRMRTPRLDASPRNRIVDLRPPEASPEQPRQPEPAPRTSLVPPGPVPHDYEFIIGTDADEIVACHSVPVLEQDEDESRAAGI